MLRPEWTSSIEERLKDLKELQQQGLIPLNGDFYPAIHYPGITMYPPITEEELFKGYILPEDQLFVVYAHIPFCIRYCNFCHYPVKINPLDEEKEYYLDALEKEMDIYMRRLKVDKIKTRSILVGGGTPTYLTPTQLKRFLKFFTARLDLSSCTQFSYDVDPNTLLGNEGKQRLEIMKAYGVKRLTIGIQSFDDEILKKMNRAHNAKEAEEAIKIAKEMGFKVNIEFIYGYPGQTVESWIETLKKAVLFEAEEIQLYRIKIIPYGDHTAPLTKICAQRDESVPLERVFTMKQLGFLVLEENGYKENLRRVFSKDPKDFSHYADDQCCGLFDQIGFGLTAFSSLRDRFGLNTDNFKEYYSLINKDKLPINRGLIRSKEEQLRWALILPLKNRKVYKNYYQKITGVSLNEVFRKKIERLKEFGLLYEDEKILSLTSKGIFFADEVCHQFYAPQYKPLTPQSYAKGALNPYIDCQP